MKLRCRLRTGGHVVLDSTCSVTHILWSHDTRGRLNINMSSYQYRDSHVKDKTVSPTVLSLTWESPYLGKAVFILKRGPVLSGSDNWIPGCQSLIHSYLVILSTNQRATRDVSQRDGFLGVWQFLYNHARGRGYGHLDWRSSLSVSYVWKLNHAAGRQTVYGNRRSTRVADDN